MRTMVLSLAVLAALGLAGCSGGGAGQSQSQSVAHSGSSASDAAVSSSVSGTVGVVTPGKYPLSDKAVLTIKLVDVSRQGSAPLATKTVTPVANLPVSFSFKLKPGQVQASDLYVVQASMEDGIRHFVMRVPAPVLTKGASSTADILLKGELTPSEKVLAAFNKVKKNAGGMAMTTGTSRNDKVAHGWQVFRDKKTGDILYVVDQAKFVKGGFEYTEYAYQDRHPWVVIRKDKSGEKAKASKIERAGWVDGKLIVKEEVADGKTSVLSDADAATLQKQAEAMFTLAKKSVK